MAHIVLHNYFILFIAGYTDDCEEIMAQVLVLLPQKIH